MKASLTGPKLKTQVAALLLLAPLLGLLGGCDLSDDDEGLDMVLNSWEFEDIVVGEDNPVSLKPELDAEYTMLVLTFREDDDGTEFFRIVGQRESGETLRVGGPFDVDDDEITFFPEGENVPSRPIELDFQRVDATTLRLSSEDGATDEKDFLEMIQLPVEGSVDRLEVELSVTETSASELG